MPTNDQADADLERWACGSYSDDRLQDLELELHSSFISWTADQQWQWNAISRNNIKIVLIIVCESEFQHLMKMSIKSVCLELMGMPEILLIIMFYVGDCSRHMTCDVVDDGADVRGGG